jgi:chloramphenicol 3-O phosphotransferase
MAGYAARVHRLGQDGGSVEMTTGRGLVVVLNGASSSGKTSIARALPPMLRVPTERVSVDAPLSLLPRSLADAFAGTSRWAKAVATVVSLGVVWPNVVAAIGAGLRRAERGQVAIVDVVVTNAVPPAFIQQSIGPRGLIVAVRCSLDELERREHRRPTRRGLAARQFPTVHEHLEYDVSVDTTDTTVEACAGTVAESILARLG